MSDLPSTHREIRLAAYPDGLPGPEHLEVATVPLPRPGAGQVLVRNRFFRVSASLRMMISRGAQDVPGVPLPVFHPGDALSGEALGEVVSAPDGSGLNPGDLVLHHLGWREYAAVDAAGCVRPDGTLPDPVAYLGHGGTAYATLTRAVRVNPGDTVLVTAGGGAIGSMAGQIARLLGAGRVIGSTGSREKAEQLVIELGYDAVVLRGADVPLTDQLAKEAPDGIDVVVDLVGGDHLRAALANAREGARVALIGALAGQLAEHGTGRTAPVELDSFQLLLKKVTLRGYSSDDDPDAQAEWLERFGAWLRAGVITFPHVRVAGLERTPEALRDVMDGRHLGTVIVAL